MPAHPIETSEGWNHLVSNIQETWGTVLVIGAPDSGKTTLTKFLLSELSGSAGSVAYVDGDMGQSTLGPPTTLGMALLDGPCEDVDKTPPRHVYFVGSTSPRRHELETLVGLKRLLEKCEGPAEGIAVVDTTGYVTGKDALELKYQKIDLLNPRHIAAVQRAGELEPILRTLEGRECTRIHRLSPSAEVRRRSPEERRRYRWRRFRDYFSSVRLHAVDLSRTTLTGTHQFRIQERPPSYLDGLLVGLNDSDNFLVSLGLLETLDHAKGLLSCLVPTGVNLERVQRVRLGSVRIDLSEETDGERFLGSNG
jgi:polynucleotide 5'-hydroxyl-kinase GRC3/NOL9